MIATNNAAAASAGKHKDNKIVTPEMCYFCFETVHQALANEKKKPSILDNPTFTNDPFCIFVTWKKSETNALRGCIGTFTPLPLHEGLRKYALASALEDSRFKPIKLEELKTLNVSVSLLHNFVTCKDYLDWEIGTHGIQIELELGASTNGGKSVNFAATFLPEVAKEQGWTKVQTIDALLKKAGYLTKPTDQLRKQIKVTKYESDKLTVTYQAYMDYAYSVHG